MRRRGRTRLLHNCFAPQARGVARCNGGAGAGGARVGAEPQKTRKRRIRNAKLKEKMSATRSQLLVPRDSFAMRERSQEMIRSLADALNTVYSYH